MVDKNTSTIGIDTTDSSIQTQRTLHSRTSELLSAAHTPMGWRYLARQMQLSLPRILVDVVAICIVNLIAMFVWGSQYSELQFLSFSLALFLGFVATNQYPGIGVHLAVSLRRATAATLVVAICMMAVNLMSGRFSSIAILFFTLAFWVGILVLVPVARALSSFAFRKYNWWAQPVLIIGSDTVAASVYRALDANRKIGLRPIGIAVDPKQQWQTSDIDTSWVVGAVDEVDDLQKKLGIYWVVNTVWYDNADPESVLISDAAASLFPHRLLTSNTYRHKMTLWDDTVCLDRFTLVKQTDRLMLPIHRLLKRSSDFVIASTVLFLLAPILMVVAAIVRLTSQGPIFFQSRRVGRNQREFHMTKFRTMHCDGEEILAQYFEKHPDKKRLFQQNSKLEDDPRLTPIGNFMRRSSVDELPQFLDVLRGKMSVVGPRPMLPNESERYGELMSDYNRVLPGITGLWQVSGRNNTSFDSRLHYVRYYIQNWSIWLDLCIFAKTFFVVAKKEGAY